MAVSRIQALVQLHAQAETDQRARAHQASSKSSSWGGRIGQGRIQECYQLYGGLTPC